MATWATAQTLVRSAPRRGPSGGTAPPPTPAGPATTPQAIGARGFENQTVRMIARTSIGGKRLRVRLTNAFAGTPVVVGAAHLAIRAKESAIVAGSDRPLTFNGKPGCTLGPGVVLFSDPVDLNVPPRHGSRGEPLLPRRDRAAHHPRDRPAQHLHLKGRGHDRAGGDGRAGDHPVLLLPGRDRRGGAGANAARAGHLRRFHHRRRPLHLGDQSQLAGTAGGATGGQ